MVTQNHLPIAGIFLEFKIMNNNIFFWVQEPLNIRSICCVLRRLQHILMFLLNIPSGNMIEREPIIKDVWNDTRTDSHSYIQPTTPSID